MAASVYLAPELFPLVISRTGKNRMRPNKEYKMHSRCALPSQGASSTRRLVVYAGASILAVLATDYGLVSLPVLADDKSNGEEEKDGVLGAIQSLLETNTKTKSGRVLPKAYLKTAKEVVKTLRESVQEDSKDNAKFRRTADAAKESINSRVFEQLEGTANGVSRGILCRVRESNKIIGRLLLEGRTICPIA